MNEVKFRFQNLQIWQLAIEVSDELFDLADHIENTKHYRFAEQLRSAVLSISNNIAEGSGSYSKKDFANFLNMSRRSIFEVVNILIVSHRRKYLKEEDILNTKLAELDKLSRKISAFRKTLITKL